MGKNFQIHAFLKKLSFILDSDSSKYTILK
jgi:hypothetical protein